jgi:ribosomal-protein-alanine N-acetyltransferase
MLTLIRPHVRWMIRRDMAEVVAVEAAGFPDPWAEGDILCLLRERNCIGMVAEHAGRVVGHLVYELQEGRLELLRLAVCPKYRDLGVGAALAAKLTGKLSISRRTHAVARVPPGMPDARAFLRAVGFAHVAVEDDHDLMRFDVAGTI